MADKMKRHNRRTRHLMKTLRRSRHASVQNIAIHELVREIDGRHGFRRMGRHPDAPARGGTGQHRPMTKRARHLLSQLRKTKIHKVQQQLVRELKAELEHGRRLIDKARQRARKTARRAAAAARAAGRTAKRTWRGTVRGTRSARRAYVRAAEQGLQRGERKKAEREKRPPQATRPAPGRAPYRQSRPPRFVPTGRIRPTAARQPTRTR